MHRHVLLGLLFVHALLTVACVARSGVYIADVRERRIENGLEFSFLDSCVHGGLYVDWNMVLNVSYYSNHSSIMQHEYMESIMKEFGVDNIFEFCSIKLHPFRDTPAVLSLLVQNSNSKSKPLSGWRECSPGSLILLRYNYGASCRQLHLLRDIRSHNFIIANLSCNVVDHVEQTEIDVVSLNIFHNQPKTADWIAYSSRISSLIASLPRLRAYILLQEVRFDHAMPNPNQISEFKFKSFIHHPAMTHNTFPEFCYQILAEGLGIGLYDDELTDLSLPVLKHLHHSAGSTDSNKRIMLSVSAAMNLSNLHLSLDVTDRRGLTVDLNYSSILAGDFNAEVDDDVITMIDEVFDDIGRAVGELTFPANNPTKRIDYIFLNKIDRDRIEVIEFKVFGNSSMQCEVIVDEEMDYCPVSSYISDHLGIHARFRLK